MRSKARGLALHGGPPGGLEERDPAGCDFWFCLWWMVHSDCPDRPNHLPWSGADLVLDVQDRVGNGLGTDSVIPRKKVLISRVFRVPWKSPFRSSERNRTKFRGKISFPEQTKVVFYPAHNYATLKRKPLYNFRRYGTLMAMTNLLQYSSNISKLLKIGCCLIWLTG